MHASNRRGKRRAAGGAPQPTIVPEMLRAALPVRSAAVSRSIASTSTSPQSSAYPSAYPTDDEDENAFSKKIQPFRFLSLPSELRNKIYSLAFSAVPPVIDLDPHTFSLFNRQKTLSLFRVSRQLHNEASHHFFSTHTFRLFPTYPGRYFKTKKPLLARLPAHYRASVTSLELRLGPGWNNPPRGWVVNDALGLADCTSVRVLKVFVECDPSDGIFKGFRMGEGAYERFSAALLDGVLEGVNSIKVVEFDAYSSVKRSGDMMAGLGEVVAKYGKVVGWGPERGWDKDSDQIWLDAVLMNGLGKRLSRSVAIFS